MRDWAHSRRLGTPADEAGSVVPRQPPASKLANLFRIDAWDHALGLVTQQLGGRVTEHPPVGWLGTSAALVALANAHGLDANAYMERLTKAMQ